MAALPEFARAWLRQRESGREAIAAIEAAELRNLSDADAMRYSEALLAAAPRMGMEDPRWRTSGLVEQQRLFALARR